MIGNIAIKLAIALLYIIDILAISLPIFVWFIFAVYAQLSVSVFFWGWLLVMIFAATIWLRLIDKVKKYLWEAFIEREDSNLDDATD